MFAKALVPAEGTRGVAKTTRFARKVLSNPDCKSS